MPVTLHTTEIESGFLDVMSVAHTKPTTSLVRLVMSSYIELSARDESDFFRAFADVGTPAMTDEDLLSLWEGSTAPKAEPRTYGLRDEEINPFMAAWYGNGGVEGDMDNAFRTAMFAYMVLVRYGVDEAKET